MCECVCVCVCVYIYIYIIFICLSNKVSILSSYLLLKPYMLKKLFDLYVGLKEDSYLLQGYYLESEHKTVTEV